MPDSQPGTSGDQATGRESAAVAPLSADLTWPAILERALEEARHYAEPRSLGDALLDAEGHLRLAYDRGQQDERAAAVDLLRRFMDAAPRATQAALAVCADAIERGEHHA